MLYKREEREKKRLEFPSAHMMIDVQPNWISSHVLPSMWIHASNLSEMMLNLRECSNNRKQNTENPSRKCRPNEKAHAREKINRNRYIYV